MYPRRVMLLDGEGKAIPAQFVGRISKIEKQGFEFMGRDVSLLEKMTRPPQLDERELMYLAWEVDRDFTARGLRLRFENDEAIAVPALELETLRPGRLFVPATLGFNAAEGGVRLQSSVNRSPGP